MSQAKDFVDLKINGKKVVVFSKTYCPFCTKAKKALESFKLSPDVYEVVELDDMDESTMDDIQNYLNKLTGGRSVPRVFVGGKFIGGGDQTAALASSGQLKVMLQNSGAI